MREKILIIGSCGFIGKNAVAFFSENGYDVYSADIVIKLEQNYSILNPEHLDFTSLFSNEKFDICINATGAANVSLSFQNPVIDYNLNVVNVFHILEAIRKMNPTCKFINFSSAAVYGNPTSLPINENAAIKPLSPYGIHKQFSENICKEFYDFYNIPTISLRIFSAYGEGLRKQLFWDLYSKINKSSNNEIILFGTGSETRDFIYIRELLAAIEVVIQNTTFNGSAVNISSGIETTIKEAVEIFVKAYNIDISVIYNNETKIGDPLNWKADISLLKSMGFESHYDLHKGLGNYSKWLKNISNND